MLPDASCRARLVLLAVLLPLLSGCYVAQAARGHWAVMRARQPISALLVAPDTAAPLRTRLQQITVIREFASRELLLPDNSSYRSYADLGRPYVVWNVVATPELSLQPRQWCFPIAGCVAYRGYFSEAAARRFAAQLADRGDDVAVFGVAAYSTLGRFSDPVLNTMTGYGQLELAGVIFHELAHQKLYVAGDSAFNEAFATTVEEQGLARYAARHATTAALAAWNARRERAAALNRLVGETGQRLRALYSGGAAVADKRAARQQELAALGAHIRELEARGGFRSGLHEWLDGGLNNAHIAAFATYRERQPVFQELFKRAGGDFASFYAAAEELATQRRLELRGPPRRRFGPHPP
jgi:predicted aminopeptidase